MHGNLSEWCQDDYQGNYQANNKISQKVVNKVTTNAVLLVLNSSNSNILVNNNTQEKSVAGGSWDLNPCFSRSAYRNFNHSHVYHLYDTGFRVVCVFERTL